jgi:hypothetical protein
MISLDLHLVRDKSTIKGEAPRPAPIVEKALVSSGSVISEKSNPYPIEASRPTSNPAAALYSISPSLGFDF